mmetsp:Transcript_3280/g.5510  ORF Transcript_3280/g.5510 Transcript_3280/m.5510 type:complete len:84 (+) Transcript_3280:544-795(+)
MHFCLLKSFVHSILLCLSQNALTLINAISLNLRIMSWYVPNFFCFFLVFFQSLSNSTCPSLSTTLQIAISGYNGAFDNGDVIP